MGERSESTRCYFPGPECPRNDRAEHADGATFEDEEGTVWCHYCPSSRTGGSDGR